MKHNIQVIFLISLMFLAAQLIGLYVTSLSVGEKNLVLGLEKPELDETFGFAYIFILIILVTVIALIIAKFRAIRLWKVWFFLSIFVVLTISLSFIVGKYLAVILSLLAAYFKVIKPNMIIHNISELFLYGGLSILFAETLSILAVALLIILIAVYDMYAVWKSKHMIRLAKFQSKTNIFAGLLIPYREKKQTKVAMLGGGDIGFPLLFSAVVMVNIGVVALIIPFIVTASLLFLLYYGKKDKFYPAMPYLGAGCFIGYGLALLIL